VRTRCDPAELQAALVATGSVQAAAQHLMDVSLAAGFELPSLYLERGGRLRCVAQRGYWQVYDGLEPGAGVLGSTFFAGETRVVTAVDDVPEFIRAVPGTTDEVCVPLWLDGRVVGAFNIESRTPIDPTDVAWIEAVGAVMSAAVEALGGTPVEEPAELLARLGAEMATLTDGSAIVRHALRAALTLSGMGGAALFPAGTTPGVGADRLGPLSEVLARLSDDDIAQISDYVAQATSSYAVGVTEGEGFEATRSLRQRGVASLVVLALMAKGQRIGVLVLVDALPRPGLEQVIPLLETLAATAAAMLTTATYSAALLRSERALAHQASHDPLTGLANRTQLMGALTDHLADESRRRELMVLFVDLDGFKTVNDAFGHRAGDRLLVAVADRLRYSARSSDLVARIGGDEFVLLCPGAAGSAQSSLVSERILARLAAPFDIDGVEVTITACIGLAAGTCADDAEAVLAAADRAMYAAKRAGAATSVWADEPS
jgi:diguanylate cyclase (GGDEF)-like protein